MKIYLAGGIFKLSDTDARDWREYAAWRLKNAGHETLDPMRRDYRGREKESFKEIVHEDIQDISSAGAVLAMCRAPSWGTAMELRIALTVNTPVLAVTGDTRQPISPWLRYHARHGLYHDIDSAIDWIVKYAPNLPERCGSCAVSVQQQRLDRRCMSCASRAAELAELVVD